MTMAPVAIIQTKRDQAILQGGDVIIRTSEHAAGIFVVHKDFLTSQSPYFAGLLSDKWTKPVFVGDKEATTATKVYELDLYFDHGTRLALLTPEPDKLLRTAPDITVQDMHMSATDLQHNAWIIQTYDNAPLPTPQFGWSEHQPKHCINVELRSDGSEYEFHGVSNTYGGYFNAFRNNNAYLGRMQVYKENLRRPERPRRSIHYFENEHSPCAVPDHTDAVRYVRTIWQTLLAAMYGHRPAFNPKAPVPNLVLFVANLVVYADYLMLDDKVRSLLQHSIEDIPGIWESVKDNPQAYLHFGYSIRVPNLYLDAARHLMGTTPVGCFQAGIPNYALLNPNVIPPFNQEMLTLLQTGSHLLKGEVVKLAQQLMAMVTIRKSEDRHSYSPGPLNIDEMRFDGKRSEEVASAIASLLAPHVLDVAHALLLDRLYVYNRWELSGPGQAATKKLRDLQKWLSEQSNAELESRFELKKFAAKSGFYVPKLREDLKRCMDAVLSCVQHSKLYGFPNHFYGMNIAQKQHPLRGPEHSALCSRCFRARAESDDYFSYFNTIHFWPIWLEKPWPLSKYEAPCPHGNHNSFEEIEQIETTPATFEWLEKIGVGDRFGHVPWRNMRKTPQLTIDTKTKDYLQEAMAFTFVAEEFTAESSSDYDGYDEILTAYPPDNPTQDPDPLASKFDNIDWEGLAISDSYDWEFKHVPEDVKKVAPCDCASTKSWMKYEAEKRAQEYTT